MPSKRYKKLPEKTKDLNAEVIEKLLPEVKKNCTTKFDESLDLSFQINNKQKKSKLILELLLTYQVEQERMLKLLWFVKTIKLKRLKMQVQILLEVMNLLKKLKVVN